MLMQNFGATIKKHYGMLWYFLEWPILNFQNVLGPSYSWKLIITVSLDTKDKMENQPRLKNTPSEFNFGI